MHMQISGPDWASSLGAKKGEGGGAMFGGRAAVRAAQSHSGNTHVCASG